jgi:hypothetical protein
MEDVGIFHGLLAYFTAIWYILWTLGIFCGNLEYFSRFGIMHQEKSGNPGPTLSSANIANCARNCKATNHS